MKKKKKTKKCLHIDNDYNENQKKLISSIYIPGITLNINTSKQFPSIKEFNEENLPDTTIYF